MRNRMLAFLLPLASCLSVPASAQLPAQGDTPWVLIRDVSVDAEGERIFTREADLSALTFRHHDPRRHPEGAPRFPDPPVAATAPSMTEVTITQQSGGYERDTRYVRVAGEWVVHSDSLESCRPERPCRDRPRYSR